MVFFYSFNFLCLLLLTVTQTVKSQLSDKSNIQTILSTPENKDSLSFVAVFLLTTLHGATAFGGPGGDRVDFFQRVQASKATWAHPIKHFYAVIGKNDANIQILVNPKYCTNLTKQYHHHVSHVSAYPAEEVFECAGIRVLYLPYCNHQSWGPMVRSLSL